MLGSLFRGFVYFNNKANNFVLRKKKSDELLDIRVIMRHFDIFGSLMGTSSDDSGLFVWFS